MLKDLIRKFVEKRIDELAKEINECYQSMKYMEDFENSNPIKLMFNAKRMELIKELTEMFLILQGIESGKVL